MLSRAEIQTAARDAATVPREEVCRKLGVIWSPLVECDLRYSGPLPASGNSGSPSDGKLQKLWALRRAFELQLARLYETKAELRGEGGAEYAAAAHIIREVIEKDGYRYSALVRPSLAVQCSLDIQILVNHDVPSIINQTGDLDNRAKSIIDALRIPRNAQEIGAHGPSADEQPFICLMETDALVTELRIRAARFLGVNADEHHADVSVHVKVEPSGPGFANRAFL